MTTRKTYDEMSEAERVEFLSPSLDTTTAIPMSKSDERRWRRSLNPNYKGHYYNNPVVPFEAFKCWMQVRGFAMFRVPVIRRGKFELDKVLGAITRLYGFDPGDWTALYCYLHESKICSRSLYILTVKSPQSCLGVSSFIRISNCYGGIADSTNSDAERGYWNGFTIQIEWHLGKDLQTFTQAYYDKTTSRHPNRDARQNQQKLDRVIRYAAGRTAENGNHASSASGRTAV